MEPHEIFIKYPVTKPDKKFVQSNGINQRPTIIILALTIFCASATSLVHANPSSAPWTSIKIEGQVDNIISDDRDGSVFVSINGDIFRYSNKLELLSSTLTSTSSKVTSDGSDLNIIANKVLSIVKRADPKQDLLFSCWKLKENLLKCWLNKLNELRSVTLLSWSNGTKGFITSETELIKALPSQIDANDILIVASSPEKQNVDSNLLVTHLPSIGRFKITKNLKFLSLEIKSKSVLQHQTKMKILQEYIHVFSYNQHTYFVLNQGQTVAPLPEIDSQHYVRLARICNNDTDLYSYTEIPLSCNNQKGIQAKCAHFGSTNNLYVVFEPTIHNSGSKASASSLCSYSMNFIDDKFNKAISDCHSGEPNAKLLMKYIANVDGPPLCQSNPTSPEEWCTSKFNSFIDGTSYRYIVEEDNHFTLVGLNSINFIYTSQPGLDSREVIFIGTESGHLTKMSSNEDFLYTIDFNSYLIKTYKIGEKFGLKSTSNQTTMVKYSAGSHNIAVTSGEILSQIDINACHYYSCQACLNFHRVDPTGCVWCGNTCSKSTDCKKKSSICPPVIKKFHPNSGPVSGFTKLTIEGENFGSPKGLLKVRLNKQDCLIESRSPSGEFIECTTKPIDRPVNATLTVNVSDISGSIDSEGNVVADVPFSYLTPRVYGLYPKNGTLSGTNRLNIYGEHLDVGLNRSVYLGDSECEINIIENNIIGCIVKPPTPFHQRNSNETLPLKLFIDGQVQLLEKREQYAGLELATGFTFLQDHTFNIFSTTSAPPITPANSTDVAFDELHEENKSSFMFLTIVILFIMISFAAFYVIRNDKITQLKLKFPDIFESRNDKVNDVKVMYRSPNPNGNDTINGLVKLNGSVMSSDYFCKPEQFEQDQPLMNTFIDSEMASILTQEKILIDRNRLTLGHVLGSGQFGRVYKGFLKVEDTGEHTDVAVKTLHNRSSWDDGLDNRAFLEEGLMMKDFEHENVLALIGVTFDSNGLPMVITPFMLYGDLRSYISDEASSPTVKELIDFGTQIARGMAYLSGLKFVHRDLAARNCMLDENLKVKVADFGLSRDIYERDYYSSDNKKAKLPVKWMAIESLETCIYNTKTDVWSFGVVLWELMTRGVVPYPDVDNFDLYSYLKEGRRMLRPRYCPLILYKIMLSCWSENPANRPTFAELVEKVSDVITQLQVAKDGQQKVSREATYCDVLK